MFNHEPIDIPKINVSVDYPPKIDIKEIPGNGVSINLWRSRTLSTKYTGNIPNLIVSRVVQLFKQGFDRVQIDCGRPGRTICGYHWRTSQAEKDAQIFLSDEALSGIRSLTKQHINASQSREQVSDYNGLGEHIIISLQAEK